jgi:hypothetical protein
MRLGEPVGVHLDLRKVCFTVDWSRDFHYEMPEAVMEDQTYNT